MQSILEILNKTTAYFAQKGIPNAKIDAQILVAHALKCKRLELFLRFDEPLTAEKLDTIRDFVRRRARREPLQYILGETEFFGVPIKCDARALIPRPETEELCEILCEQYFPDASAPLDILELGVGTGAVSLALKKRYANANVRGADISQDALSLARENAAANGIDVDFFQSNWFENASGKFDLIFSNPPYLTDAEVASAQPEVSQYEPMKALRSDDDGFADLRKILARAPEFLKDGAIIACECGIAQPEKLAEEFAEVYAQTLWLKDASNRPRFIIFKYCKK